MENQKRALLIVNPIAGKMKFHARMFDIIDMLCCGGYAVTAHTTVARGNATEIAAKIGAEYDIIICCGGDGTLNEVISGVLQLPKPVNVGYIPAGSTNDFANSLKLPHNIDKAAQAILNGVPHGLDVGRFNGRPFTYTASFGAFASSSYLAPQKWKNRLGHFAYVLQGIKDLPTIHPVHVKVTTPEAVYEDDYIFGALCNSTSIGGMVRFNENTVDFNDGLFELVLVKNPKNANHLARILHCISIRRFEDPIFTYVHTSAAKFEFDRTMDWSLDGEHAIGGTEANITIDHSAITLIS